MTDYQLWLGDCLEEMNRIEDGSVDMILADLPYGVTNSFWDSVIPLEPLWEQCKRVIKSNGAIVLTASQPFTSILVMSNLKMFKYSWVWQKEVGTNFLNTSWQPMKEHEDILVFSRNGKPTYIPQYIERKDKSRAKYPYKKDDRKKWIYGSIDFDTRHSKDLNLRIPSSVVKFNREMGLHPNQKPVALMEYLIKTYTNPGDLVLDNTFGSCTTGEACLRTGRRFIGIEKDPGYFRIGQERMARVAAELRGEFVPKVTKGKVEDLPLFAGVE